MHVRFKTPVKLFGHQTRRLWQQHFSRGLLRVRAAPKQVIILHFVLRTSAATLHLGCAADNCSCAVELICFIF